MATTYLVTTPAGPSTVVGESYAIHRRAGTLNILDQFGAPTIVFAPGHWSNISVVTAFPPAPPPAYPSGSSNVLTPGGLNNMPIGQSVPAAGSFTTGKFLLAQIDGAAGTDRSLQFTTAAILRWVLRASSTPETGGNAGSNLLIDRYSDTGVLLGTSLTINRTSGLIFSSGTISGGALQVDGSAGTNRILQFTTSTVVRWQLRVNNVAESGGNVGSDVQFDRYSDTGVYLGTPFGISRATGLATLNIGGGTIDGAVIGATTAATAKFTAATIDGAAATNRTVSFTTASVLRWQLRVSNVAESGGNAGSDIQIDRYSDAGAYLSTPFGISRATGLITVTIGGGAIDGTAVGLTTPAKMASTGINFGSNLGVSNTDLSKHVALWGTTYGMCVTVNRFNYNANNGAVHVFLVNGVDVATIAPAGSITAASFVSAQKIRNTTMAGAVAGTPGTLPTNWSVNTLAGLSQQVVGTGTDAAGLVYIDVRLFGTTSATQVVLRFDSTTGIVAAQNQTWTEQVAVVLSGGTTANVTSVQTTLSERDSGGSNIASVSQTFVPGIIGAALSLNKFPLSYLLPDATTAFILPGIQLNLTNAAAVDITLRIAMAPGIYLASALDNAVIGASLPAAGTFTAATSPSFATGDGGILSTVGGFTTLKSAGTELDFQTSNAVKTLITKDSGATTNTYVIAQGGAAGAAARLQGYSDAAADVSLQMVGKGVGSVIIGDATHAVGFYNNSGAAKQTISGSKGANAALASLLTALAALGLITDSTT